jgi:membrane-associated protease RseP (regulator of RpoE activity)
VLGPLPEQASLVLHPVAFAAWIGFFVTAINLLPVGQLDGGHVLYALAGRRQEGISRAAVLALAPLGFLWWGWFLWGGMLLLLACATLPFCRGLAARRGAGARRGGRRAPRPHFSPAPFLM